MLVEESVSGQIADIIEKEKLLRTITSKICRRFSTR